MTAALHRASQAPAAPASGGAGSAAQRSTPALPRWELAGSLGEGRWSRVYAARRMGTIAADYAIKVPKQCPEALAMLRREALVGSSVSHPNLVPVLEWQFRGAPFLVMPRIAGRSLRETLAGRRRDFGCLIGAAMFLRHSVWTIRQVASALHALHEAGWLHGNVNPDNVLVSSQGHATLWDLGLARRLNSAECRSGELLLESFACVAPEQLLTGALLTSAADVYSLGVMLHELLTGQPMFDETDPTKLALLHLRQVPSEVREAALHVPPALAKLVTQMLAKEPLRRPAAADVARQLTRLEIELLGSV
jgi:eukaryotic-like serine/threonine-protein kinase